MTSRRRFRFRTFFAATAACVAVLGAIVAIPQWLSREARLDVLRSHVGQTGRMAASIVDGDLHAELVAGAEADPRIYAQALEPLVRFHSASPEIFYLYTMVDRGDGDTRFVLDTAASPELVTKRDLRASDFMEPFELRPEYASDWLERLAAGEPWVTPSFQYDDYGYFLTAHAPIHDGAGHYVGFVGVDYDLGYYLAQEARFERIGSASLLAALLASLLIGYLVARYHYDLHDRIAEHYHTSIRDGLTGLLNRRGALDAIARGFERSRSSYAVLLVDIDDLKRINDTRGHAAGDAVIADLAAVIRRSIRECDECARLGGDEFMILAPDCDARGAEDVARRILAAVPFASFSVSIGATVNDPRSTNFDRMYREADAALYHAKSSGKRSFVLYEPFMSAAFEPAH